MFAVTPVEGHVFGFWEWSDPFKGRPIAVEGDLSAEGMRFAIVVARWNAVITERLLEGAMDALLRSGAARRHIEIVRVPGAWEVPAAARMLADRIPANGGPGAVDAIITLGLFVAWRDSALRSDLQRSCARHRPVATGDWYSS